MGSIKLTAQQIINLLRGRVEVGDDRVEITTDLYMADLEEISEVIEDLKEDYEDEIEDDDNLDDDSSEVEESDEDDEDDVEVAG
jgi:hypothetical protein